MPLNERQVCGLNILAKLSWGYLARMAQGRPMEAGAYLDVFRATFLAERPTLAPGLPSSLAAALPTSLETVFDDRMRTAQQIVLTTALAGAGVTGASSTMSAMPRSAGELGTWFRQTLQTAVSAQAQDVLSEYVDIPMPSTGNLSTILATIVRDDRRCVASPPPPPVQSSSTSSSTTPSGSTQNSGTRSSGGSSGSSSGGMFVALALGGVVLWGWSRSQKSKGLGKLPKSTWKKAHTEHDTASDLRVEENRLLKRAYRGDWKAQGKLHRIQELLEERGMKPRMYSLEGLGSTGKGKPKKSKGHIAFTTDGEWEFYEQKGEVFRAKTANAFDVDGYRHGRWEGKRSWFDRLPESVKKGYGLGSWQPGDGRAAYAKGPMPVQKAEAKYEVSLTTRRMERSSDTFTSVSDAMRFFSDAKRAGTYKSGQLHETANGKRRMIQSF